ncbi:M20/M25/M40 family metallo-hydrolase [Citroniella saccharovorans]|uniref:M20/M25/M40 family metallo-hydrolase n=1 Tax=Citroniella saccharovorans TaxID=2053367 RepID=A0AAW9MPG3_9FIRM|nr:M20/M25/M40 family metallo-hydrolase [Citroniella saccharovorans]MEB3428959.1 M20/M25/M40 family metallo-hydrolase [Citroniella saccharovorans]
MIDKICLVKDLTETEGASGFEENVVDIIKNYGKDFLFESDSLKNAYLGDLSSPLIMLDSHTDEVGFIVRFIDENGLISILNLGAIVPFQIGSNVVKVRGKDGKYYEGVISSKPIHFMEKEELNRAPEIEDIKIDMGGYSREELLKLGIGPGSPVVPATKFSFNEEKKIYRSKAFDNRLGCAASILLMEKLKENGLDEKVVAAFASQEEVGGRGAEITARKVNPKYAIVFEGSPSDDYFVEAYKEQCKINGGPQIRHYDGSYISDELLISFAIKAAEKLNINIQHAVRKGSGTNAGIIHRSNLGVRCLVVGIPSRYIHSFVGYSSLTDLENSVDLAFEVIKQILIYEEGENV